MTPQEEILSPVATARALSELIESHAAETASAATLAPAVVDAIQAAGLFQLMVPAELGGGNAEIPVLVEVVEEISRADPSTGWAYMANAASLVACPRTTSSSFMIWAGEKKCSPITLSGWRV